MLDRPPVQLARGRITHGTSEDGLDHFVELSAASDSRRLALVARIFPVG